MTQNEKLKELFDKIKEESKQENYVKSELDEAVEKMGAQEFCDWVDEWLGIMKEEEKVACPPKFDPLVLRDPV